MRHVQIESLRWPWNVLINAAIGRFSVTTFTKLYKFPDISSPIFFLHLDPLAPKFKCFVCDCSPLHQQYCTSNITTKVSWIHYLSDVSRPYTIKRRRTWTKGPSDTPRTSALASAASSFWNLQWTQKQSFLWRYTQNIVHRFCSSGVACINVSVGPVICTTEQLSTKCFQPPKVNRHF